MLVGPSKWLKQIIQIELNRVKNPNRPKANQLAILQAWLRIWTQDYQGQIHLAVRAGLQLGASELQVQRFNQSARLPPCDGAKLHCIYLLSEASHIG